MKLDALAWAVGVFEGEGTVGVYKSTTRTGSKPRIQYKIALQVYSTDADVIRRVRRAFRCGRIWTYKKRSGNRPLHMWHITKRAEFERLTVLLYPHLSVRRRSQVRRAWKMLKLRKRR